jgi:hypothetical protein
MCSKTYIVFETAETKNSLHHLLFEQSISQQLTEQEFPVQD